MTFWNRFQKRTFDLFFASVGLIVLSPVMAICVPLAWLSTGSFGIFRQRRVGKAGELFTVYKMRTMIDNRKITSTVTVANDSRITPFGVFLRRTKIDEVPQLWNVLIGDMSLVGPRPDVEGFADKLTGESRRVLELRPGITGPATIKYRNEECLLAEVSNPERYNAEIIYPDKVDLNLEYLSGWSLLIDLKLILVTIGLIQCPDELASPVRTVVPVEGTSKVINGRHTS